jgi:hypothetical protein
VVNLRINSDEKYVIDLISDILGEDYEWQKRFDTLLGDIGKNGHRTKLPVDAYFPKSNLIIEYREKQHFEPVNIMDSRMTVSGVNRKEQRKIYDLRKDAWAEVNNINFLVITCKDLAHKKSLKLLRSADDDRTIIAKIIQGLVRR